jgi:hypothetical protein
MSDSNLIGQILVCLNGGGHVQVTCHGRAAATYYRNQTESFRVGKDGVHYAFYGHHWVPLSEARVTFYPAAEEPHARH